MNAVYGARRNGVKARFPRKGDDGWVLDQGRQAGQIEKIKAPECKIAGRIEAKT
jgi:hypothetical protein